MKNIGLANILFSKTQQQVLGLLYGQPDNDFYTNEIIRFSGLGTGTVQRELAKLVEAGIINIVQLGNQKRYQANTAMPFFPELRSIILKTFGLADVIKSVLEPLKHKIEISFVYGSIASQQDTANSDVDLMLITDKVTYADFFKRSIKAEEILKRKINPTFYTRNEWTSKQHEKNNFIIQVIKQPKIFLIGTSDDLKSIGKSRENRATKI